MSESAPAAPYAFISYASTDRDRVLRVVDALRAAGVGVWLDQQGIAGGENYALEIAEAIKGAAALLLMASPASLASRNVKQEVALGWRYARPYLPLRLDPVAIPDDLAYWLEAAQWVDVLDRPASDWLPQVLAALAPYGIAPPEPVSEGPRLVGRERELALLRERLDAASTGRGSLVLIGGEAGVGKTALAEATLHDARGQGWAVLEGHCFDLAETPPYGPFVDLFARYERPAEAPPPPDAFTEQGTVGAVPSQLALFVQVQNFLKALAALRPAILLLDDLHWADPASLDLLRFVARSLATLRLLVIATYRSDELTRRHPLYQLLPQLAREESTVRLDLDRLDDAALRALVDERYPLPDADAARLVAYLRQHAEGNALYAGELLRALEEHGTLAQDGEAWRLGNLAQAAIPTLLRQVIEGRVVRLGEEALRLLALAAVIGQDVPLTLWAAVAEIDEDGLLETIERVVDARLMTESSDGTAVRFAHALIREALHDGLLALRRRRVHRAVGEALAAAASPDPDAVAHHFAEAGDERAAEWLIRAGERAARAHAQLTAAARLEAAVTLLERRGVPAGERGWLLLRAANLLWVGETRRSLAILEAILALADEAGDRALALATRNSRGLVRCLLSDYRGGLADLAASVAAWEQLPAADRARLADPGAPDVFPGRVIYAAQLANAGRYVDALAEAERYLAVVPGTIANVAHAENARGHALAGLGRPEEARAAFARSRASYRAGGGFAMLAGSALWELEVVVQYQADRPAERAPLVAEGDESWAKAGGALGGVWPHFGGLPVLLVDGYWGQAATLVVALLAPESPPFFRLYGATLLAQLARDRGDAGAAWGAVREVLPEGASSAPGAAIFASALPVQRIAAQLALDAGDLPAARAWLAAHDRWLTWSGAVRGRAEGALCWAAYHRAGGDLAQARRHAEAALAHAGEPRQPLALVAAHRALGELETADCDFAAARDHLDAALALADACAASYERALTLLAQAELRAAMGEREAALALLAEVRAICTPLGARPALERAERLERGLSGQD